MNTQSSIFRALAGTLALFVVLQACGDDSDDNEKPPVDVTPTAGTKTGGTGGKSGGNEAGNGDGGVGNTGNTANGGTGNTGTGNTGNTGDGGEDQVGGQGGGNGIPPITCDLPERGDNGCYNCPKDGEQAQWLNRCVDGDCVEFDDDKLVKLGGDRSAELPALPN